MPAVSLVLHDAELPVDLDHRLVNLRIVADAIFSLRSAYSSCTVSFSFSKLAENSSPLWMRSVGVSCARVASVKKVIQAGFRI